MEDDARTVTVRLSQKDLSSLSKIADYFDIRSGAVEFQEAKTSVSNAIRYAIRMAAQRVEERSK